MIIEPTQFIALFTCRLLPSFSIPYVQCATEEMGRNKPGNVAKSIKDVMAMILSNRLAAKSVKVPMKMTMWHEGLIHMHD